MKHIYGFLIFSFALFAASYHDTDAPPDASIGAVFLFAMICVFVWYAICWARGY